MTWRDTKLPDWRSRVACSDELRRALNLKKNQLPQYIYQMRVLGYPPGYLADAQVCTSGIAMFDRHGKGGWIQRRTVVVGLSN